MGRRPSASFGGSHSRVAGQSLGDQRSHFRLVEVFEEWIDHALSHCGHGNDQSEAAGASSDDGD
jgi:hypothetical protein